MFVIKDAASGMLDLLPGEYIIGITFSHSSEDFKEHVHTLGDKVWIRDHDEILFDLIDKIRKLVDTQKPEEKEIPIGFIVFDKEVTGEQ